MKLFTLAALAFVALSGTAFADSSDHVGDKDGRTIEQSQTFAAPVVTEGRQAAPINSDTIYLDLATSRDAGHKTN